MKRTTSIFMALSVVAAMAATSLGASAGVPKPQIVDPLGDANFVNDQGTGDGSFGDQTAADVGTVSDILGVTMSNDAKNLMIAFDMEAAPPAATAVAYRLRVNPEGPPGTQCLLFEVFYPGANNTLTAPVAHMRDVCGENENIPIEVVGTTLIVPRSAHEGLGKGKTLSAPQAQTFQYSGVYPNGIPAPTIDTTKVGTDFKFVDKKKKKR